MRARHVCQTIAVMVVLTGCAGKPAQQRTLADTGHGSVEEVLALMSQRGVPCAEPTPVALPPGTEQAVRCTIERKREEVLLVHFASPEGATSFTDEAKRNDEPGVYTPTWALRTRSAATADAVRAALAP